MYYQELIRTMRQHYITLQFNTIKTFNILARGLVRIYQTGSKGNTEELQWRNRSVQTEEL